MTDGGFIIVMCPNIPLSGNEHKSINPPTTTRTELTKVRTRKPYKDRPTSFAASNESFISLRAG